LSENENIVAETAARIFADLADPQTVNSAKSDAWKGDLWRTLEEAGLTLAWVPDTLGGPGASLADGFEVLGVAGRFAAPVAIAETLLAGWLLSRAGIASRQGAMTVAPTRPMDRITLNSDSTLSGRARGVPFATDAAHLAVLAQGPNGAHVALVPTSAARITAGRTLAGDPLCDVVFDRAKPLHIAAAPQGLDQTAFLLMGSVVRAAETAGALEAILGMAVRYANDRVAFERPIAKFQAVPHNLARIAGEVSAAMMASGSAADAIAASETFNDATFLEAAAAKIRASEAAQEGSAIAHQVHGAIGFTKEYLLHRFTLRLLSWRDDFGNESHWAVELGNRIAKGGADALWPLLASR
jgi:acyl-CoA dehydrogenase